MQWPQQPVTPSATPPQAFAHQGGTLSFLQQENAERFAEEDSFAGVRAAPPDQSQPGLRGDAKIGFSDWLVSQNPPFKQQRV